MERMVDVCGGYMTHNQMKEEIDHYWHLYHPKRIVVVIEHKNKGSYVRIYIPKEDFERRR